MFEHFLQKMYVMVSNIVGEKRIDLAYPIQKLDSSKEVAIVSMFSYNIQYEFTEPWMIELELGNKQVMAATYARRELIDLIEGKNELTQFDKHPQINKTNKSACITEMVDKLDNTDNLEDKRLRNILLRYHVTCSEEFTCFEPVMSSIRDLGKGSSLL